MKNATLLKIASLFIFLLSAQFSFGQTTYCGDYPDYSSSATYVDGDQVHYQGKIWENRYGNNVVPSGGNVDYVDCGLGGENWCHVTDCTAGNNPCETTTQITFDDFESGWGNWNDGGNRCEIRYAPWYCESNYKIRLTDNNGSNSTSFSDTYNLSSYDKIIVEFGFIIQSFEYNEDWFLEFSANNGSSWTQIKQYIRRWDGIANDICYNESVTILATDQTFNSQNKLRFRADAGGTDDYLYIDDIKVSGTGPLTPTAYTVTGYDLSLCPGDTTTVTQIGLSDSEDTFTYQLLKNGTNEGSAITGTGSAISFGNFNATGTYTIQATGCSSSGVAMSGNVVITTATTPTASFTASATNIDIGDAVSFSDTSTGNPTSWSWDFNNDGSEDSTDQNPTYTFNTAGSFTVTLTATNSCGSDTATTTVTVNFGTDILFSEDFSGYPENIEIPDDVDTITGSGTSATNPNGVSWSLTGPESANEIKLHHDGGEGDNGHIHTKKVNGTATFETDPITVSGYTGLNLKIYVDKLEKLDNDDTIELGYDLDGLGYTVIETITGYGDFTLNGNKVEDVTIDSDIIAIGDSLVIYIKITHNNNWDEKFEWDDITLTGTPFYNVWQGIESDLVTNTAKWSKGSQPTEASNVWIPNTKHLKLTDDQEYNTVNARATSQLTIEKTGSLKTVGDFTKIAGTGTVTLNSDATEFASIVVGGTATGNITYNRWVNKTGPFEGNNWDFVGSPLKNQRIDNFVSANSGVLPNSGDIYGIAKYFNEWDSWEWYTDSNIGDDIFNTGESYYTSTIVTGNASGATLAFTGEIPTGTQTKEIINNNGTNTIGRRWEMVANPYASYIHGNPASGDAVNNFVKVNLDLNLLEPSFGAIYAWDGTGGYTIYNLSQINTATIAPGQGFWIAARQSTPQQLQFTPAMQTVEGGDDFISGAPILLNYMLNLKLYHGTTEKAKTSFYFQQGLTDGLDTGYDAGALEQTQAISSRLTENDQGYNMSINAMSIETVYNQSIPLVINQQEGQPFRVSISENTIPEEVNVYLEDVLNGTLTSLKDQDFELSAQSDLSEDGRFYIRFTTQSLAIYDVLNLSNLNVYKINKNSFITIKGLTPEMGKTTATLYNMLGMKVREKALDSSQSAQRISTQGLASGVYIINLKAGDQAVSKKIIIQ
jgi:PKD repeat protein